MSAGIWSGSQRSLSELRIAMPMSLAALGVVLHEVVRRNGVRDGIVYLQITRGVAKRDHAFPPAGTRPAIVVTASRIDPAKTERLAADGIAVVTVPDNRWDRVDIKSIALLPNVLAKQAAREQGAREAWFVDTDGTVTEGSSSNAWIVTPRQRGRDPAGRSRDPAGHHANGPARRPEGARSHLGGACLYRGGGDRRPGGLHHLGEPDRDAGGPDRRTAGRKRGARADRDRLARRFPSTTPRNRDDLSASGRHMGSCWACAASGRAI